MELRKATLADLPILRSWDAEPHVVAAGGNDDVVDWPTEIGRDADWQQMRRD